jgi:ligand-binding sensor domain-containing protein
MKVRELSIVLFLVMYLTNVSGQEYSYARYDVLDGLAGSVVYHGVEDKDGFLWFATETGLSRFDGTHFRNFTTADGLPDNEAFKLFVDSKNRIWIISFNRTACYYYKGKFHTRKNDSLLKKISISGQELYIAEDSQGNLLLSDSKNIYILYSDQQLRVFNSDNDHSLPITTIGVTTEGKFKTLLHQTGRTTTTVFSASDTSTGPPIVLPIHLEVRGNFLSPGLEIFRTRDSLYFGRPGEIKRPYATPPGFKGISALNDTLCSINTDYGAIFFDIKKNKPVNHVLKNKIINAVLRDREDNYWFLTTGAGIFRVGSFDFRNVVLTENNIDNYAIFSIKKIDSLIYIGSEKSLLYTLPANSSLSGLKKHPYVNNYHNRIISIISGPDKNILLGTDNGILAINEYRNITTFYPHFSVKSFFLYKGQLVVSSHLGVNLFPLDSLYAGSASQDLFRSRAICCYPYHDTFYIGTMSGLYQVGTSGKPVFMGDRYDDLQYRIADIKVSGDDILWIGTSGRGLIGYRNGKIEYHIGKEDGLTSNICKTLLADGQNIWVGTDKGLNRVSIVGSKINITRFTKDDGLISDIVNAIEIDNDLVYVGTPAGLTCFNVNQISQRSYCKLQITGLQTADNTLAYDTTGFTLPPADNAIRFDYVGISYRSAGDITYRYRLVGLNNNWQTTRETFLSYPSLPSGDYELQLIATNKFGVESEMARISFLVEKRLWEKTWFRLLVLLIIIFCVWYFVASRIRKIRRQNDEKIQINDRMAELEQMALKAQMNPHFIFNSLNSVQQYVIDKDLRGANKFITEFSRLIRLTLDISSKAKISIYEEISYLSTYLELEKTKFEDKFSYSVVIEGNMDPSEWFIPPMILQPYVENSIRHGVRYRHDKLGHIRVSFSLDEQYLICQVEDNGVGRKKAAQYKSEIAIEYQSKGMTLTAKRIEMLNKNHEEPVLIDIEDLENNHIATGTRVVVRFPVQDAGHES